MRKLQEFRYISCVHVDIYILLKWCRYILLNCNLYAFAKGASTYNNGLGYTDLTSKGMLGIGKALWEKAYLKNFLQ